jgi:hypothetical protein
LGRAHLHAAALLRQEAVKDEPAPPERAVDICRRAAVRLTLRL